MGVAGSMVARLCPHQEIAKKSGGRSAIIMDIRVVLPCQVVSVVDFDGILSILLSSISGIGAPIVSTGVESPFMNTELGIVYVALGRFLPEQVVVSQDNRVATNTVGTLSDAFQALNVSEEVIAPDVLGGLILQRESFAVDYYVQLARYVLKLDSQRASRRVAPYVNVDSLLMNGKRAF